MARANLGSWRRPFLVATTLSLLGVGNVTPIGAQQTEWSMNAEKIVRVKIELQGTRIDEIPNVVYVVTDEPADASKRLLKMGGTDDPIPTLVHMRRLDYWFVTPKEAKEHVGMELPKNSVIYGFSNTAGTADVRKAFAKRFDLKDPIKVTARYANSRIQYLYSADDGFYVRLDDLPASFTCSLHPTIRKSKPGLCPICGLSLVPVK